MGLGAGRPRVRCGVESECAWRGRHGASRPSSSRRQVLCGAPRASRRSLTGGLPCPLWTGRVQGWGSEARPRGPHGPPVLHASALPSAQHALPEAFPPVRPGRGGSACLAPPAASEGVLATLPGPTAPSKGPPPPAGSILVGLMRTQCPGTPASSVSQVSGSSWLCVLLGGPAMLADLHQASQRCASSLRPLSALLLGDSDAETIVRFLSLFSQRGNQRPAGSLKQLPLPQGWQG